MPGSNYLVARSLDRATDESSSARRVSSNGSEAARLTTHPTDDPLLVASPTLTMSLSPPANHPCLSPAFTSPVLSRAGERLTASGRLSSGIRPLGIFAPQLST